MSKGWEINRLGDICEIYQPKTISTKEMIKDGKYLVYGANGIIGRYDQFNHEESQLLITCRGATCGSVNISEPKSWINGNAMVVRPKNGSLSIKFLEYFFRGVVDISKCITGAAQPQITRQTLAPVEIVYPLLSEQQHIVKILDEIFTAIDKAKQNAEKNLQNSRELFESYLQNVFVEKGKDWEEKRLNEIAKVIGGYSFKSGDFKSVGKYQVLRMGNVRPGIIRNDESPVFIDEVDESVLKKSLLQINDVIITQTGTKRKRDYGYTVIIDKKNYLLNQRIAAIRFSDNYLPNFFLYFSWTNFFKDQFFANEGGTVGQGNVGISAITDAMIPFCSMKEQMRVVSTIDFISSATKKLETIYQQKLNDLEELKKSILQKAFSGELTVKEAIA